MAERIVEDLKEPALAILLANIGNTVFKILVEYNLWMDMPRIL
jgi:hypothetical protein